MKTFSVLLTFVALALGGGSSEARAASGRKALVVYFSHSGNTRRLAAEIARQAGADLFEICPAEAYPNDYDTVVEQARREIAAGKRPALRGDTVDLAGYDLIFVGSPCWWGTVAPPVATFLSSHDFAGKTLLPFMTHGGSGMGRSEADIRALCPDAGVKKGLPVRGSSAGSAAAAVERWLRECGVKLSEDEK